MNKKLFLVPLLLFVFCLLLGCSKEADEASINEARELYEQSITTHEKYQKIALRKKIIKLAPDSAYGYFSKAWFIENKGARSHKKIVKLLDKAIALDPTMSTAYYNRAISHTALDEFEKAFDDYGQAIDLEPDNRSAYINRGVLFQQISDHSGAIDDFNEAIRLEPDYAKGYYNRGVSYYWLKNYRLAIIDFKKTLELDPNYYGAAEYLKSARAKK